MIQNSQTFLKINNNFFLIIYYILYNYNSNYVNNSNFFLKKNYLDFM